MAMHEAQVWLAREHAERLGLTCLDHLLGISAHRRLLGKAGAALFAMLGQARHYIVKASGVAVWKQAVVRL